jgi:predicted nucleotidyltransferase
MSNKTRTSSPAPPTRMYWGADVPMPAIRRFARQVAERFRPDKIILFGSHAYGTPHADSDVDLLVVMRCRNQIDQMIRIRREVPAPFAMDLIVRTPHGIGWRLAERESFHTHIVERGTLLYETGDARVGQKGRSRSPNGRPALSRPRTGS